MNPPRYRNVFGLSVALSSYRGKWGAEAGSSPSLAPLSQMLFSWANTKGGLIASWEFVTPVCMPISWHCVSHSWSCPKHI